MEKGNKETISIINLSSLTLEFLMVGKPQFRVQDVDSDNEVISPPKTKSEHVLSMPELVFDCKFHPVENLVVSVLVSGQIHWLLLHIIYILE